MSRPIRTVFFDAVGTLIQPVPKVDEVYWRAGVAAGLSWDQETVAQRFRAAYQNVFGTSALHDPSQTDCPTNERRERVRWRDVIGQVFAELPDAQNQLLEQLWDHFAQPQHWRIHADVERLRVRIGGLTHCDWKLGIASNFDGRLTAIVEGHRKLAGWAPVISSAELGVAKPDPRFFERIATICDQSPHELLMVGDDPTCDYHAPRQAGWQALVIARTTDDRRRAEQAGVPPQWVINSLEEVANFSDEGC